MKSILLIILVLLPVLTCSCSVPDDVEEINSEDWTDPFKQNQLIGRAVNLGNALEAPNEGDWGVTLKEEYFQLISDAGFDAVRIPIRWSAHTEVDTPFTISEEFFFRIDWAIGRARANGLAVIINIHHYEEIFSNPESHKQRFLAIWHQIANRYQAYPHNVFFEILNEPHENLTAELWNSFLAEAISMIRTTNPDRTLIIGTAEWGGPSALQKLAIPEDETNLILTVHYYTPFEFTHQGAEWVDESDKWLGTNWAGSLDEIQQITSEFTQINHWSEENNIPIFLGEFGSYNKADFDSRVRWTSFIAREAEKKEWSWAYWEFCSGFGIYNQDVNEWHTGLLDALIPVD